MLQLGPSREGQPASEIVQRSSICSLLLLQSLSVQSADSLLCMLAMRGMRSAMYIASMQQQARLASHAS